MRLLDRAYNDIKEKLTNTHSMQEELTTTKVKTHNNALYFSFKKLFYFAEKTRGTEYRIENPNQRLTARAVHQ